MTGRGVPRGLFVAVMGCAVLAPLAGSPYRTGRLDVAELARDVVTERDHVTAVELATWIRDRKPGLEVVDVRSAAEFAEYHVPTAEHVPLEALAAAAFPRGATIVLYSGGGAHGAQAWVFLRALGYRDVYFLSGGLAEWIDDVMNPEVTEDTPPETLDIARYFGGEPRRPGSRPALRGEEGEEGDSQRRISTAVADRRRRGC